MGIPVLSAAGPIFVQMGIEVGHTLTVSLPEGGKAAEVTDANGTYYTIVEEDGNTVAAQTQIKPLGYTVLITGLKNTMKAIVPAGKSLNETYCEVFHIDDFSEMLNTQKEGHTFEGWYTDEAYTEAFGFDMPVNGDITIYAKWKASVYTVTYVAEGKVVDTVTVEHGKDAVAPRIPAKQGYTAAWDQDGKCITADTTITAVYTKTADGVPETGDNSDLLLWVTLMAVNGSGLLAAAYCGKKRRIW